MTFLNENERDPRSIFADLNNKRNITLSPEWAKRALILLAQANPKHLYGLTGPAIALGLSYLPYSSTGRLRLKWLGNWYSPEQYSSMVEFVRENRLDHRYTVISIFDIIESWTNPANLSRIEIDYFRTGYGYDTSSTSVQLSLVVVGFYLIMVITHLIYAIAYGISASSWDTIAELVTLALNSDRPQSIRNTSAGINTLETYRQPVNIRVNAYESLEIVFDADRRGGQYSLVGKNKRY